MKIVKLNGCIHIHNGKQFVRRNFANTVSVVGRKNATHKGKPLSTKQILSSLSFNDDGIAVVE